jgi:hypothetical protein
MVIKVESYSPPKKKNYNKNVDFNISAPYAFLE